jgi:hypothetical protein
MLTSVCLPPSSPPELKYSFLESKNSVKSSLKKANFASLW